MNPARLLPILALAAAIPAQSKYLVSPAAYAAKEGTAAASNVGLGPAKASYQQIHDDLGTIPLFIYEVAFRLDNNQTYAGTNLQLTMRLSNTPLDSRTITGSFAGNHGSSVMEVLTNTNVNWPATPNPVPGPTPFTLLIPFPAKVFLYTGQQNLCFELRIHSNSIGAGPRPDTLYYASPPGNKYGVGCRASDQAADAESWAYISPAKGGWDYKAYARNLANSSPAFLLVGFNDKMWGAVPLPLDLTPYGIGPGNGTNPCQLLVAPVVVEVAGFTQVLGTQSGWVNYPLYASPWYIPYEPTLVGLNVYSQFISQDATPSARTVPLVFSKAVQNWFPPLEPVARCYMNGDDQAILGYEGFSSGYVVQFTHR